MAAALAAESPAPFPVEVSAPVTEAAPPRAARAEFEPTEGEVAPALPPETEEADAWAASAPTERPVAPSPPPPAIAAALPSLEDLIERIPAELRTTLDDLFRARFTAVRRLPSAEPDK